MAGKRGNGEGSISQLPSGKWRAQATIEGRRVGSTYPTHKEAQQALRRLLGDADRGLLPPAEQLILEKYVARWLDAARHSIRPATAKNYADLCRLYILPTLGKVKLAQLQPAHLSTLYGKLLDAGKSPKTVKNVHTTISRALGQAVKWNLVSRNVAALVQPPHLARKEIAVLDAEQTRVLLVTVRGERWSALLTLALATGARQGELLGLRWRDVDLTRRTLRIQRQLLRDGTFNEPKTAKGRRTIDLPQSCVAVLKDHKRQQTEERLLVGPDWVGDDLLFCTHQGKPLGHRNVVRAFKAILIRAELPDIAFHALRHTAATLLLLQGTHPKIVQERLGHSTIAMTLDIYSHSIPSMGRAAADQLDALFA